MFTQPALWLGALLLATLCACSAPSWNDDAGEMGMSIDTDLGMSCSQSRCLDPTVMMCCNDVPCVDTSNDPKNCGGCSKICPNNQLCVSSQCVCMASGATSNCAAGTVCCPDGAGPTGPCKTLATDTYNCGACNRSCNIGETCSGGQCQCGTGAPCTGGKSCCNGTCVDTQTDATNCSMCGTKCMATHACMGGVCEGECMGCTGIAMKCCGFTCANTLSDPNNCGKCGNVCPPWLGGMGQCAFGICVKINLGDGGMNRDM